MLRKVGLPVLCMNLIMDCVKVEKLQFVWNGELTEAFTPGRGIRQGDLLSFPFALKSCLMQFLIKLCWRNEIL